MRYRLLNFFAVSLLGFVDLFVYVCQGFIVVSDLQDHIVDSFFIEGCQPADGKEEVWAWRVYWYDSESDFFR